MTTTTTTTTKMDHILLNIKSYLSFHHRSDSTNLSVPKTAPVLPPPHKTSSLLHVTPNLPTEQMRPRTGSNDDKVDYEEVQEIATFLKGKTTVQPVIGIICGSGLGGLADLIKDADIVDYKDIPHFPVSTVAGHKGVLVFGSLNGVPVMCMKGRFHPFEGYSLTRCTLPVRVMKALGVQTLIVTNASGGLNSSFDVADIMIIRDHIFFPGFSGNNPLRGPNDNRFGARFPPMNKCYDRELIELANECATKLGITRFMRKGVYVMLGGPNYETVAEAKFLRNFGADAVGMSTVHEVIVAQHSGLRVLGFSLITNKVVTDYDIEEEANHEEVLAAAAERAKDFENLISEVVQRIGGTQTNGTD